MKRTLRRQRSARRGFTLVELMTATALTLIVMSILARVFVTLTDSITNSRAQIEMNSRLQAVAFRLQKDLEGYTVFPDPLRKDYSDGFIEVIEGPIRTGSLNITGINNPNDPLHGKITGATTNSPNSVVPYPPVQTPFPTNSDFHPDTTLGDRDDLFGLTTRSKGEPFVGRFGQAGAVPNSATSEVAEVHWFLRGTTLYRRQLLVGAPTVNGQRGTSGVAWWMRNDRFVRGGNFSNIQVYSDNNQFRWNAGGETWDAFCDISAHAEAVPGYEARVVPNTLADLSRREYRFGHSPVRDPNPPYPYESRLWGALGMPTLAEASVVPVSAGMWNPAAIISGYPNWNNWDRQLNPHGITSVNAANAQDFAQTGWAQAGPRSGEDVVLTNVIGFDVKVWDPGAPVFLGPLVNGVQDAVLPGDPRYPVNPGSPGGLTLAGYGAFVDLGYAPGYNWMSAGAATPAHFSGMGIPNSGLAAFGPPNGLPQCVYDTWTDWYEHDGILQSGAAGIDAGRNGFDDDGRSGADDVGEWDAPPPYPFPLRGVKITVRVIDPDTDQVREVSVVQDFIME